MADQSPQHMSPFDAIRHIDDEHGEYWSARELSKHLGYTRFDNFTKVLIKAEEACQTSGQAVLDHMLHVKHMIVTGKGAKRPADDVLLSRYGAYLVVQNADPTRKPVVGLGQTYFAVQTLQQELADELSSLPQDELRLLRRSQMNIYNTQLAEAARDAGVIQPRDFALFQDHGYRGLYGGLHENDIHSRKHLSSRQKISDYMGSEETGANIFRATQTEAKLRRDQVDTKEQANTTHFDVGREVREAIRRLGGTMPENLPTPTKSIQQLQREEQKRIESRRQLSLFNLPASDE